MSLKEAAYELKLDGPTDLLKALKRERQVDLFFRLLRLRPDVQWSFHMHRLIQLPFPDQAKRMLKIAAIAEPLAVQRSAS